MNRTSTWVIQTAHDLLELQPQPVPRFRLLRDVLGFSPNDPGFQAAQQKAFQHPHVRELDETQLQDGTWGRFHTQDTAVKQRFETSESAIERALALGLDQDSPLLRRTVGFLTAHIAGHAAWSDPPEKHDNPQLFPYFTRLVSAANLAWIDPHHPMLAEPQRVMVEMLKIAFGSGTYQNQDEMKARAQITGIQSKTLGSFLLGKYGLLLLASASQALDPDLEDRLLQYVLQKHDGVYYLYGASLQACPPIESARFASWLGTIEILSRFAGWPRHAAQITAWIESQRNAGSFWDFGSRTWKGRYFPLSSDWRRKENRVIDCTVRVLALLRRVTGA